MTTIVTLNDYYGIINSFTEEEIKEKYGKLIIMNQREYEERKKKSENNIYNRHI